MFIETVDQFAKTAVLKAEFLRRSPLGFTISAMIAGAYVGLGIILIFSSAMRSTRRSARSSSAPRSGSR